MSSVSPKPRICVIGGTYIDLELMVEGTIRVDTSLQIASRSHVLGGPGFTFAVLLSQLGAEIELVTKLGLCSWSERAREALRANNVNSPALDDLAAGELDIATLVIDGTGRRLALNEWRLAREIECPSDLMKKDRPVLIASPTSLLSLLRAIPTDLVNGSLPSIFLAPHSHQMRQLKILSTSECDVLGRAVGVACLNESDFTPEVEAVFTPDTLLIVTRGAEGCRFRNHGGWSSLPAEKLSEPLLNTNGAGEAFFSGVVVSLLMGEAVERSIRFGTVTAARYISNLCAGVRGLTSGSWGTPNGG